MTKKRKTILRMRLQFFDQQKTYQFLGMSLQFLTIKFCFPFKLKEDDDDLNFRNTFLTNKYLFTLKFKENYYDLRFRNTCREVRRIGG